MTFSEYSSARHTSKPPKYQLLQSPRVPHSETKTLSTDWLWRPLGGTMELFCVAWRVQAGGRCSQALWAPWPLWGSRSLGNRMQWKAAAPQGYQLGFAAVLGTGPRAASSKRRARLRLQRQGHYKAWQPMPFINHPSSSSSRDSSLPSVLSRGPGQMGEGQGPERGGIGRDTNRCSVRCSWQHLHLHSSALLYRVFHSQDLL